MNTSKLFKVNEATGDYPEGKKFTVGEEYIIVTPKGNIAITGGWPEKAIVSACLEFDITTITVISGYSKTVKICELYLDNDYKDGELIPCFSVYPKYEFKL